MLVNPSPLLGFSHEDMKVADVEIYVLVRGFYDVYSTIVQQRTSYVYDEIIFGRKFIPMYHESEDGKTTILEFQKLNEHIKIPEPRRKGQDTENIVNEVKLDS